MLGVFDLIGMVGVFIILVTYSLLQTERMSADSLAYSAWNALGSALVMSSLVFGAFNLSAMVIEVFWTIISLYGVQKAWRRRRAAQG